MSHHGFMIKAAYKEIKEYKCSEEKTRYEAYKQIYQNLRRINFQHNLAKLLLEDIINEHNNLFKTEDSITEVDMLWYRCNFCNRPLRFSATNTRHCVNKSCSMYHKPIKVKKNERKNRSTKDI